MATRLYYVATTAAPITPAFDAGWTSTTGVIRRNMATTKAATTEQVTSSIGATGPAYTLAVQLVSPPLAAQTISGTYQVVSRGRESATAANVNKRARCAKVYSSAGVLRGTLDAWATTASTTELSATTLQGQQHALNNALTSVVCQAGDYIVVEIGYGVGTSGTTPQATMEIGGTGTDHANANADVTGSVPWVEFSANLTWQSVPSTVNGTASADLSFTAVASGVREVLGGAAGAFTFTADAAGTVTGGAGAVSGTAVAALAFTASASGTRTVAGSAATPITFGAVAAGTRTILGQAARPLGFSAAASGVRTIPGAAATSLTLTAAGAGARTVMGAGAVPLAFVASATGQVSAGAATVLGVAATSLAFSASASGTRVASGQMAAPFAFAAVAAGAALAPVTVRPYAGATPRPGGGTTTRPAMGTTARTTGTTVRPLTGTTTRP